MKNCTGCKYADWQKTKAGKLHPSGNGRCRYEYKLPPLPQSMYWGSFSIGNGPQPYGGHINRKEELKDDCVYFSR